MGEVAKLGSRMERRRSKEDGGDLGEYECGDGCRLE